MDLAHSLCCGAGLLVWAARAFLGWAVLDSGKRADERTYSPPAEEPAIEQIRTPDLDPLSAFGEQVDAACQWGQP